MQNLLERISRFPKLANANRTFDQANVSSNLKSQIVFDLLEKFENRRDEIVALKGTLVTSYISNSKEKNQRNERSKTRTINSEPRIFPNSQLDNVIRIRNEFKSINFNDENRRSFVVFLIVPYSSHLSIVLYRALFVSIDRTYLNTYRRARIEIS